MVTDVLKSRGFNNEALTLIKKFPPSDGNSHLVYLNMNENLKKYEIF